MQYTHHRESDRTRSEIERYNPMEEKAIAQLAYHYWEQRGRPFGSPEVDWLPAEREIRSRTIWIPAPDTRRS